MPLGGGAVFRLALPLAGKEFTRMSDLADREGAWAFPLQSLLAAGEVIE